MKASQQGKKAVQQTVGSTPSPKSVTGSTPKGITGRNPKLIGPARVDLSKGARS